MKPIIGIVEWPYFDQDGDKIYEVLNNIVEWIIRSGGRPIGIFPTQIENFTGKRLSSISPMTDYEWDDLKDSLNLCSAIIKPGALKIYSHERLIYGYCLEKNMPYLGICAGMQLMAFHNKGNIENVLNNNSAIEHASKNLYYAHDVIIEPNTQLRRIIGKDSIEVNSKHRYHIPDSGINRVSAYSLDGIIEAIENPTCDFNIGLQWHPELLPENDPNSQKIFGEFIEAAKVYQKKR